MMPVRYSIIQCCHQQAYAVDRMFHAGSNASCIGHLGSGSKVCVPPIAIFCTLQALMHACAVLRSARHAEHSMCTTGLDACRCSVEVCQTCRTPHVHHRPCCMHKQGESGLSWRPVDISRAQRCNASGKQYGLIPAAHACITGLTMPFQLRLGPDSPGHVLKLTGSPACR